MKLLVLGAGGMLGHQLCHLLSDRMEVWGAVRGNPAEYENSDWLPQKRTLGFVEVRDFARIREILDSIQPDAIVNGVGIVKQRDEARQAVSSIQINSLFPHQLADLCAEREVRVIQLSTDCVFSGLRGGYTEVDIPDPVDLYGLTKLLGELDRPGCLTLRTSFIGWQLNTFSSLLSWFALQRSKNITGYQRAIYSGLSTGVLAQLIGDVLLVHPDLSGLYQVSSEPISKFDLLVQLRDILGWKDIAIEPDAEFFCDRSLLGTRFTTITNWHRPGWPSMLQGLADEWPGYARYYAPK